MLFSSAVVWTETGPGSPRKLDRRKQHRRRHESYKLVINSLPCLTALLKTPPLRWQGLKCMHLITYRNLRSVTNAKDKRFQRERELEERETTAGGRPNPIMPKFSLGVCTTVVVSVLGAHGIESCNGGLYFLNCALGESAERSRYPTSVVLDSYFGSSSQPLPPRTRTPSLF